jgi:hypothetical protein
MSGEALNKAQLLRSELTARLDWVLVKKPGFLFRTALLSGALQFHWGKPPPAADPTTFTIIRNAARGCSDDENQVSAFLLAFAATDFRRQITGCFEARRDDRHRRLVPSFHVYFLH